MTNFTAATPVTWTRNGLEGAGYEGFVTFSALRQQAATTRPGIYVVLRAAPTPPVFRLTSPAGKFKDFTAPVELLSENWVPGAEVICIGLATHGARHDGIHRRLKQFRRTGAGTADNHGGGVWVFQLADADNLIVCWRAAEADSDEYVVALEHHLIADFAARAGQGCRPFANRKA